MDEPEFDPKDIEELEDIFVSVLEDHEEGYSVEVIVSRAQARDMVANWVQAMMGDPYAVAQSFIEYSQIVTCLMEALQQDGVED